MIIKEEEITEEGNDDATAATFAIEIGIRNRNLSVDQRKALGRLVRIAAQEVRAKVKLMGGENTTIRLERSTTSGGSVPDGASPGNGGSALPRRTVNQKVLPTPGVLSTPTAPPIISARALVIARPRPVPP